MQEHFPNARTTETEAGHFLQEEVPDVIAEAVLRVLDQVQPMVENEPVIETGDAGPEAITDTAPE